jgi:hypothetical protein
MKVLNEIVCDAKGSMHVMIYYHNDKADMFTVFK